jgi:hypothetical protein
MAIHFVSLTSIHQEVNILKFNFKVINLYKCEFWLSMHISWTLWSWKFRKHACWPWIKCYFEVYFYTWTLKIIIKCYCFQILAVFEVKCTSRNFFQLETRNITFKLFCKKSNFYLFRIGRNEKSFRLRLLHSTNSFAFKVSFPFIWESWKMPWWARYYLQKLPKVPFAFVKLSFRPTSMPWI